MLLLDKFSQSLVELEFRVDFEHPMEYPVAFAQCQLKFPKLKKLISSGDAYKLLSLMETHSLTSVEFHSSCSTPFHAELIFDFLKKQPRLKRLNVNFCSMFFDNIKLTDMPFALTELSLAFTYEMSSTARLNLHSSLRNMSDSLETFHMTREAISEEGIQLVVNELPKLKSFRFWLGESLTDIPNLKRNTSITALTISHIESSIPKSLILALENLRSLTVHYFSMQDFKEDLKWIVKNASKLEFLIRMEIQDADEDDAEDDLEQIRIYYQLLKTQDESINQNINILEEPY